MSNNSIDPRNLMSSLEDEMEFIESSSSGGKTNRVKIAKGHLWRLRFLPVVQTSKGEWWGRYYIHWINNRPTLCPQTSKELGGLASKECPVCVTAEKLNADRDQFVSRIGYRATANPQWLMYCLVVSRDDGEREVWTKDEDLWKPYEFWATRATMADISQLYREYARKDWDPANGPDYSFLDLLEGATVVIKAKRAGYKLTPERPGPIMDADRYDEVTQLIWSQVKKPDLKLPSDRELRLVARKLEEYAATGGEDDREFGRGRGRGRDDYDEDDDRRGARGRRSARDDDDDAPRRRRDDDDDDDDGDDRRRGDDRDDRGGRDEPERRSAPPSRSSAPPPPSRPVAENRQAPPERRASEAGRLPPPPSRAAATPPPGRRSVPPPPARAAGPAVSSVDDDDNAPEEGRDPAPPETPADDLPPVDSTDDVPMGDSPKPPSSPPPPARPKSLTDRLRAGIGSANTR